MEYQPTTQRAALTLSLILFSASAWSSCDNTANTPTTPDSRFAVVGNEVIDYQLQVAWTHCPAGLSGTDCEVGTLTRMNWQEALQYAEQQAQLEAKQWRLPNIKELFGPVEANCRDPAMRPELFPRSASIVDYHYWSSTPTAHDETNAWVLMIPLGVTEAHTRTTTHGVLLIRDLD